MLFNVPIHYKTRGRIEKKGPTSIRHFHEVINIDIPIIEEEVAPVVLVWDEALHYVREYEGRYYMPDLGGGLKSGSSFSAKNTLSLSGEIEDNHPTSPFFNAKWNGRITNADYDVFEVVIDSQRNVSINEAMDIASEYLIVNGNVYKQCMEPHYVVQPTDVVDETGGRLTVYAVLGQIQRTEASPFRYEFHISDFDAALRKCRQLNSTAVKQSLFEEISYENKPGFVDDRFNDELHKHHFYCRANLENYIQLFREEYDLNSDLRTLQLYCSLRAALEITNIDKMMQAVENIGQDLRNYLMKNEGPLHMKNTHLLDKAVKYALERPISIEFDPHKKNTYGK